SGTPRYGTVPARAPIRASAASASSIRRSIHGRSSIIAAAAACAAACSGSTTSTPTERWSASVRTFTRTRRARAERRTVYGISAISGRVRAPGCIILPERIRDRPAISKSKVRLPRDVRTPYDVYLNGVQQQLGVDFSVQEGSLVFEKDLRKDKISGWRWL